jgi:hypothetical protein
MDISLQGYGTISHPLWLGLASKDLVEVENRDGCDGWADELITLVDDLLGGLCSYWFWRR